MGPEIYVNYHFHFAIPFSSSQFHPFKLTLIFSKREKLDYSFILPSTNSTNFSHPFGYRGTGLKNWLKAHQTLSLGWKSDFKIEEVISSKQAILILSGVAGLSRGNQSLHPISALAALMASLIAKNTQDARKKGGSPTALDEWMALTFGWPYQLTSTKTRKRMVNLSCTQL